MDNIRGSASNANGPAPTHHPSGSASAHTPAGSGSTQFHPASAPQKKSKRLPLIIGGIVVLLLIGLALTFFLRGGRDGIGIDSSKYQAVFFTNGQVYFGKLQQVNDEYMKLTDIYYLQTQESAEGDDAKNPQQSSSDQNSNIQLIKLGEEIHGPEDEMVIVRDQMLFYENIKSDGQVAKKIEEFKKNN